MSQKVLMDRFFDALVAGDRAAARKVVDECLESGATAEVVIEKLIWPVLEMVENLFRNDSLTKMAHHYATRLMRMLVDQLQTKLVRKEANGRRLVVLCGPNEPDEIAGQLAADLMEAAGFQVYFPGGGVANDEIREQVGALQPHALVMFGSTPSDLPYIRQLIDLFHESGVCPRMQIVVGGGVFNRAEGLNEEIGADIWARTPAELVGCMTDKAEQRSGLEQRTVGKKKKPAKAATSAA